MSNVEHPKHYQAKIEPIEFIYIWDLNFNLGNVIKYVCRAGKKDKSKTIEDLEKAKFYLEYEIEHQKNSASKWGAIDFKRNYKLLIMSIVLYVCK